MRVSEILESIFLEDEEDLGLKIEDELTIKEVYLFNNGVVAVFDQNGKQVPFLQALLSGAKFHKQ